MYWVGVLQLRLIEMDFTRYYMLIWDRNEADWMGIGIEMKATTVR